MILSRAKPAIQNEQTDKEKAGSAKKQVPTIEQFLEKRDYFQEILTSTHQNCHLVMYPVVSLPPCMEPLLTPAACFKKYVAVG